LIWDYSVSHAQLLLRSAKEGEAQNSLNIDLVFSGVFYVELRESLNGIRLVSPTQTELARLESRSRIRQDGTHTFFGILSNGERFFVGASHLKVAENTLGPKETSLDFPMYSSETDEEKGGRKGVSPP